MPYQVFMHQVAVLQRNLEGAELVVRRVLEECLGGPEGVLAAYLAAPQLLTPHLPASDAQRAAASRWWAAVEVALDAARTQFPALALRLDDEALAEALAEELVTIEPLAA
ncbi:hypothetical protein [Roseateles noduli]|uniref:hypothetical protein n=1 Tax=Roseateles noduli TaxID=2052484 RepID=UPI003D65031E